MNHTHLDRRSIQEIKGKYPPARQNECEKIKVKTEWRWLLDLMIFVIKMCDWHEKKR